jgi:hypothetical protein
MIIELMNIVLAARETSSVKALCKLGVRSSNYPSPSRRIPDRTRISPVLHHHGHLLICITASIKGILMPFIHCCMQCFNSNSSQLLSLTPLPYPN